MMRDAFLANSFIHFIGEYFGKDMPKYSKTKVGSPVTQAHFSSLLVRAKCVRQWSNLGRPLFYIFLVRAVAVQAV